MPQGNAFAPQQPPTLNPLQNPLLTKPSEPTTKSDRTGKMPVLRRYYELADATEIFLSNP